MSLFPTDPKKIKAQITRYERALQKEYEMYQFIDDSNGNRYLVGPLYLLMGDVVGAVKSFAWFERMFPDDIGEPGQLLCWALALYRAGDEAGAARKLRKAMLANLYLLPHLFKRPQPTLSIWHGSNWQAASYLREIAPEYWGLWDAEALAWAERVYESTEFLQVRTRYIEIEEQLKNEPVGPRRSELVAEASALS